MEYTFQTFEQVPGNLQKVDVQIYPDDHSKNFSQATNREEKQHL